MSRIADLFGSLKSRNRAALIPFITAGDPAMGDTVAMMQQLVRSGADLIELGVPFSDPMADGPVIQRASERALAAGVRLADVLAMVARFRETDGQTPVVLMGYLNPLEAMGYETFARRAAQAGVDGVLTVDLPAEAAGAFGAALRPLGLDPVYLVAPTTSEARMARLLAEAGGFVYYVSLKGVTGAGHVDADEVARRVAAIKALTSLPVGVGFGIRDAETAARMAAFADAVVVGSRIVSEIEAGGDDVTARVGRLVAELRVGMDAGRRGESS